MKKQFGIIPILAAAMALGACGAEEGVEEGVGVVQEGVAEGVGVVQEGVAGAANAVGLGEWDTDRDSRLAMNEFGGVLGSRGIYNRWAGDDAGIDTGEFGEGTLGLWDTDRDSRISEAEWTEGGRDWFEGNEAGAFGDWNANRDTFLDAGELGQGWERTGAFGRWDRSRNNLLEENEFGEGAFGIFDANNDTFVDETEWGTESRRWGI